MIALVIPLIIFVLIHLILVIAVRYALTRWEKEQLGFMEIPTKELIEYILLAIIVILVLAFDGSILMSLGWFQ